MGKHKKIIATSVPLSLLLLVLSFLVGATGGEPYGPYSSVFAIGRLSGIFVFGFYSSARHYISVANLAVQCVLLLCDVGFTLLALRSTEYITFSVLALVTLLQYIQLRQVNELLRCEIKSVAEIPTKTLRRFSIVNGIVIATVALLRVEMPWFFVVAAELQIFATFTAEKNKGTWTLVTEILVFVVNLVAHIMTYSYATYDLVEFMDIEEHFLQNLSIYILRSLTFVALSFDIVILITLTGLQTLCKNLRCKKCGTKVKKK